MAPELIKGIKYKGSQVDYFASAVVLFVMIAGTPPFMTA